MCSGVCYAAQSPASGQRCPYPSCGGCLLLTSLSPSPRMAIHLINLSRQAAGIQELAAAKPRSLTLMQDPWKLLPGL